MMNVLLNMCDTIIKTWPILTNLEPAVIKKRYCTQQTVIDAMDYIWFAVTDGENFTV